MTDELTAALWGAAAGGLVAVAIDIWYPIIKRARLTWSLTVELAQEQPPFLRIAVHNGGFWTIHSATAYLTLNVGQDDVVSPPNGLNAYIKPGFATEFANQCLCWAIRTVANPNPPQLDVFAKDSQIINLCFIGRTGDRVDDAILAFPSEDGWFDEQHLTRTLRAFVKARRYTGRLKIVSEDTDACFFDIVIDPNSGTNRLILRQVPNGPLHRVVLAIVPWLPWNW